MLFRSLIVGRSDGAIEQWFPVRSKTNDASFALQHIRSFERLPATVIKIVPSPRDRGFMAASADGATRLYFSTSERTLISEKLPEPVIGLCYAPKLTGFLAVSKTGALSRWNVDNPHPELSWRMLFGKVWYEGYEKPDYIWQSTGGSDDFEAKLSLIPLIFGTLKGAFYGLLFAVPEIGRAHV